MNEYVFVVAGTAIAFSIAGAILGYWLGWIDGQKRRTSKQPSRIISIDGDNFVILERTWDAHGRMMMTLIDQGTFEKENRIDGR